MTTQFNLSRCGQWVSSYNRQDHWMRPLFHEKNIQSLSWREDSLIALQHPGCLITSLKKWSTLFCEFVGSSSRVFTTWTTFSGVGLCYWTMKSIYDPLSGVTKIHQHVGLVYPFSQACIICWAFQLAGSLQSLQAILAPHQPSPSNHIQRQSTLSASSLCQWLTKQGSYQELSWAGLFRLELQTPGNPV